MLCRVGGLSSRLCAGNCVHCSGLYSRCLYFSFLSDRVNSMALEWGGERVTHKSMHSALPRTREGGSFPSNVRAGDGPWGEEANEGVVRQLLRLKANP